ncbi:hypothetical protein MTER_15500 [Mycolicibacter terrae]|uniref:Uncharacterized protein n=1 Tax=Mycolicibacter terrae TaxID=1788 RepID=A0AAD1MHM2_9MYCO|nr:hypothetical protein MTER_15500 [Mycolicibacter terrae]SNV79922.1 Uncharacterised protein [Mycolicibacter terrae]
MPIRPSVQQKRSERRRAENIHADRRGGGAKGPSGYAGIARRGRLPVGIGDASPPSHYGNAAFAKNMKKTCMAYLYI